MRQKVTAIVAVAASLLAAVRADAQQQASPRQTMQCADRTHEAQCAEGHSLTSNDVEAFLNGFLPYALRRGDVAGATIVVVKDGSVLFEKGYGFSDAAAQTPVDPRTTLFRAGSISKLFTWTAVMQLVEQGKLSLNENVDSYLDFEMPVAWGGDPITLREVMTHTAGFEDSLKHLFAASGQFMPLGEYVKTWVPGRIFPSGKIVAYSNYGGALAGYIVQRVSGMPFDTYVERNIFAPLGMAHSTFVQPLPSAFVKDMSDGYFRASGSAMPFELPPSAAGSLSTTADDMAHFMIAQLNHGEYAGARILSPATAELMHAPAFRPIPHLPAMALGFYHEDRNGHIVIGHGGDTVYFHSDLQLILDEDTGYFVSMNSQGENNAADRILAALFRGFMNRYFPGHPEELPTLSSARRDGRLLVGAYESSRRYSTDFLRLVSVLTGPAELTENADGTISFSLFRNEAGVVQHWREVGPFVWQDVHSQRRLVAEVRNGKVMKLSSDDLPPVFVYMPVTSARDAAWNRPMFFATLGVLLILVLSWPTSALIRLYFRRPAARAGIEAAVYRLAHTVVTIDLIFLCGWCAVLFYGFTHVTVFDSGLDILLRPLQVIGVLGVAGVVFAAWNAYLVWRGRHRSWVEKGASVLIVLACMATIWFAFSQCLLTTNLNY